MALTVRLHTRGEAMKTFRDSKNCEWTVFEVRRQISSAKGTSGDQSSLPHDYTEGWLCFETKAAKRRLTRYPERWRDLAEPELEQLLEKAQPAPRVSWRPLDDLSDSQPDAR